jgi:quercetin dioxygenase-like cupin family protein
MELKDIPFGIWDLEAVEPEIHAGARGTASWKRVQKGNVRIRIVEYSPGYLADHWCNKGHAVFVLEGSFVSELEDGRRHELRKGMCYLVADLVDAHRSRTETGVKLLIVD